MGIHASRILLEQSSIVPVPHGGGVGSLSSLRVLLGWPLGRGQIRVKEGKSANPRKLELESVL